MLVSIIIPMRNAEHYIQRTLLSIFSGEYSNIEIIIINDGSTDNSEKIINAFNDKRIHIVPGDCRGIAAAFNKALDRVKGEIVFRCDADDLYINDRISWQVEWLRGHPDYDSVCGNFSMIDINDKIVNDSLNSTSISEDITSELKSGITRTSFCTYAIKTEILKSINGCREYFVTAEDIDLQLRLGENARIWYEHKVCYLYRLHDSSITHSQPNNQRIFYEKNAREFQKQRISTGSDDLEKEIAPSPPTNSTNKPHSANKHIVTMLMASSWDLHRRGETKKSLLRACKALTLNPFNHTIWKAIVTIVLKK